jgi:hypothetical protein
MLRVETRDDDAVLGGDEGASTVLETGRKRSLHWWSTTRLDDLAGQQGYLWTGCHNNASRVLFIGNRMSTGIDNTTYYVLPSHFV